MGRSLLLGLEHGRYSLDPFLLCRRLSGGSDYAVLTRRHLLCVSQLSHTGPPRLKWAVALEDLFYVGRCGILHPANSTTCPPRPSHHGFHAEGPLCKRESQSWWCCAEALRCLCFFRPVVRHVLHEPSNDI
jgi:hypothetical protein